MLFGDKLGSKLSLSAQFAVAVAVAFAVAVVLVFAVAVALASVVAVALVFAVAVVLAFVVAVALAFVVAVALASVVAVALVFAVAVVLAFVVAVVLAFAVAVVLAFAVAVVLILSALSPRSGVIPNNVRNPSVAQISRAASRHFNHQLSAIAFPNPADPSARIFAHSSSAIEFRRSPDAQKPRRQARLLSSTRDVFLRFCDRHCCERFNGDELAHLSPIDKLHFAVHLGKERVVLAASNVQAGLRRVPRWRTMIVPPVTVSPPKAFTPRRCAFESRPLRDVP